MELIILSRVGVTIDGVLDWILHLLTSYTHHSELQVIIALSLISTNHYMLSVLQPVVSSRAVPQQRLLTVEILQLPALGSFLSSEYSASEFSHFTPTS
jgi:hypothetical protein